MIFLKHEPKFCDMIKEHKYHYLQEILLFSGLGCITMFLLMNASGIPSERFGNVDTIQAYVAVIILFNGLGMSMLYADRKIRDAYPSFIGNRRRIVVFISVAAMLMLVVNYMLFITVKLIMDVPHPFRVAAQGYRMIVLVWLIEIVVFSQMMITNFYRRLTALYKRTAELEESAVRTQYQALQNQLNPHFLFNSLNTLIAEIEYSPETAVAFTRNLSDVYRYILQCQDKQTVSLRAEMDFLKSFIFLHRVRLGDCLMLDDRVGDDVCDEYMLPPLTLQLLAENIVKHNVISPVRPMTVVVGLDRAGGYLYVCNARHPKKEVKPSGKGLMNLRSRYRLLCDRDIVIDEDDTSFTVKVPLLYE